MEQHTYIWNLFILLNRYLVQPVGALRVIKGNQSLVTEADHPFATVQLGQGGQLLTEHGHKASTRQTQGEPATRGNGLLRPGCHQLGQHWSELRWGGEDHDSSASHQITFLVKELLRGTRRRERTNWFWAIFKEVFNQNVLQVIVLCTYVPAMHNGNCLCW